MANLLGRPRSNAAHKAILKAAFHLVTNRGFRTVTANEIAAEAGVGKMTLYRHWPNKAALVMDALLVLIGSETAFPVSESALDSLRRQLDLQASFFRGQSGTLIRSLIAEAQSDAELAIAFRERWLNPRREGVRQTILAAIAEGSIREDIDLDAAIDLLYGRSTIGFCWASARSMSVSLETSMRSSSEATEQVKRREGANACANTLNQE